MPEDRIEVVDQLRGLAALSVAWHHMTHESGALLPGWLKASGALGWVGVEVFFVISGFVIPYSMARAGYRLSDCGTFLTKRLARLHPPYLVAVGFALVALFASATVPGFRGAQPQVEPLRFVLHLAYLNDLADVRWLNPVFWSLAIELQFYLAMSLAFPLLAHARPEVRWACVIAACAIAAALPSKVLVFSFAPMFALGAMAWWRLSGQVGEAAFLLAVLAVAAFTSFARSPEVAVPTAAAALCIVHLRIPRIRVLAFLGAISYSLYLVHYPLGGRVVRLGARFVDTELALAFVLVIALAASIAMAVVMHRLVEVPATRWSSRFRYRHGSGEGAAPLDLATSGR